MLNFDGKSYLSARLEIWSGTFYDLGCPQWHCTHHFKLRSLAEPLEQISLKSWNEDRYLNMLNYSNFHFLCAYQIELSPKIKAAAIVWCHPLDVTAKSPWWHVRPREPLLLKLKWEIPSILSNCSIFCTRGIMGIKTLSPGILFTNCPRVQAPDVVKKLAFRLVFWTLSGAWTLGQFVNNFQWNGLNPLNHGIYFIAKRLFPE